MYHKGRKKRAEEEEDRERHRRTVGRTQVVARWVATRGGGDRGVLLGKGWTVVRGRWRVCYGGRMERGLWSGTDRMVGGWMVDWKGVGIVDLEM